MEVFKITHPNDTYIQLAIGLRDVLSRFLEAMDATPAAITDNQSNSVNDNQILGVGSKRPDDPMTLEEVQIELRLKARQVLLLRRLSGFPSPWYQRGGLIFSRREVERWAAAQPDQNNLAAALRLRGRWIALGASRDSPSSLN